MSACRYLIMAGGTGGHIFPALAVAKMLSERGAHVSWLGTQAGMESRLVPSENITLHTVNVKGFRGKGLAAKVAAPFLLLKAIFQAIHIIRNVQPSIVVGFGGFVAAPGGIAARLLGKKLIIHEQNSVAGSTNRLLAKLANTRLEAFPNSLPNAAHVGNPVRNDIVDISRAREKKIYSDNNVSPLNLLVMGGSLGAQAINEVVPKAIELFQKEQVINVWHQTGKNKKTPVEVDYKNHQIEARIEEFVDDVSSAYQWADVIICRAGALTVSEISVAGLPAIFIPLPSAIDNHQYFNAQWLVSHDAAVAIEQKQLTAEWLSQTLINLHKDRDKLNTMQQQLKHIALDNATQDVVSYCEALCENNKKNKAVDSYVK